MGMGGNQQSWGWGGEAAGGEVLNSPEQAWGGAEVLKVVIYRQTYV